MRIFKVSLSGASVALLLVQLGLVSSVAATYLVQRWTNPRVWVRAVAFDPQLPMRGRYLSLQLIVDGCQSTLPSAGAANFPRDASGAVKPGPYSIRRTAQVRFRARLAVQNQMLKAIWVSNEQTDASGQWVYGLPSLPCDAMRLDEPVAFYIAEHAVTPLPLGLGQELWMEVTVPHKGPPRPLQLALKQNGLWKPLAFE
jgi:hypothetical protein